MLFTSDLVQYFWGKAKRVEQAPGNADVCDPCYTLDSKTINKEGMKVTL